MDTALIKDGTITNAKIASLAADKLYAASGTIASAVIGTGHISNAMIANAAITSAKIGTGEVKTANILDGNITNAKIGDLAVKTANIDALAVTDAKINNLAVTEMKIGNNAVTIMASASGTTSASVTVVVTNNQPVVIFGFISNRSGWDGFPEPSPSYSEMRITRGTTQLYAGPPTHSDYNSYLSNSMSQDTAFVVDRTGNGTWTYTVTHSTYGNEVTNIVSRIAVQIGKDARN
jgi:hypothetical protein